MSDNEDQAISFDERLYEDSEQTPDTHNGKRKRQTKKPKDIKKKPNLGKKVVDISQILHVGTEDDRQIENGLLVDMVLNRAQTLKTFMDRIRNQGVYLPCTFGPEGMNIQMMETGQKSWVHAEVWKHGCESYAYGYEQDSLEITLFFKEFHNLLKTTDANDKLCLRIYRADPGILHLTTRNERAELNLKINSVLGDDKLQDIKMQMEKRIGDYDDFEFKIGTNELQRKINTLSSTKIELVTLGGDGEDLIIAHSRNPEGPDWCRVNEANARFRNTLIRPPSEIRENDELVPLIPRPFCEPMPVLLRFLVGVCKGPSNSSSSGAGHTTNTISLRIGNGNKDLLVVENLGSFGRLVLGVRPEERKQ